MSALNYYGINNVQKEGVNFARYKNLVYGKQTNGPDREVNGFTI